MSNDKSIDTINNNLSEIDNDLTLLMSEKITFQNAQRISVLYGAKTAIQAFLSLSEQNIVETCETFSAADSDTTSKELYDILPALAKYLEHKRMFYENTATQAQVNHYLEKLVVEINEFIVVLKANCCCNDELRILDKLNL